MLLLCSLFRIASKRYCRKLNSTASRAQNPSVDHHQGKANQKTTKIFGIAVQHPEPALQRFSFRFVPFIEMFYREVVAEMKGRSDENRQSQ